MFDAQLIALGFFYLNIALVVVVALRVIMKRRPPGVSLAWLILVIVLPYGGAVLYLLMGERPLGRRRVKRTEALLQPMRQWLDRLSSIALPPGETDPVVWTKLRRFVEGRVRLPALGGNELQLIEGADATLRAFGLFGGWA